MKYDIFISYSRADEYLVNPISSLVGLGRKVFWDVRDIEPGENWAKALKDAVGGSGTVIVLWCCHSASSDWVAQEVHQADLLNKTIVPFLLCSNPRSTLVSKYQWIDGRPFVLHQCSTDCGGPDGSGGPPNSQKFRFALKSEFSQDTTTNEGVVQAFQTAFRDSQSTTHDLNEMQMRFALCLEVICRYVERNCLHKLIANSSVNFEDRLDEQKLIANSSVNLEDRLDEQIRWYSAKSQWNQRWFKRLRLLEFALAALIPFLIGLGRYFPSAENTSLFLVGLLGVVIAVITGAIGLYRFQENWLQYRVSAEILKREKYFYLMRTACYRDESDEEAFNLLKERVESLLGEKNQNWTQFQQKAKS